MKALPTPPATSTVVNALTAPAPIIFGRTLQPVTVAHVIALERLNNQVALVERTPSTEEYLQALVILSTDGAAALKAASAPAELATEIESMAGQLTPDGLTTLFAPVRDWFNAAFAPRIAAKAEGAAPLASTATDSAGPSN